MKIIRLEKIFNVIGFILFVFILYGVPLYFSQQTLTGSFFAHGEAYFKGPGHLLEENLKLGLFVSITDQIFWTAIITFILFFSLNKIVRRVAFIVILIICVVVLIGMLCIYGKKLALYSTDYHVFCRSLEFVTTWIGRILGLLFSFIIANVGDSILKIRCTNR